MSKDRRRFGKEPLDRDKLREELKGKVKGTGRIIDFNDLMTEAINKTEQFGYVDQLEKRLYRISNIAMSAWEHVHFYTLRHLKGSYSPYIKTEPWFEVDVRIETDELIKVLDTLIYEAHMMKMDVIEFKENNQKKERDHDET